MSEPLTPFGNNGQETVAVCSCGAGVHPELPARCAAGHVMSGNALALVVGARSAAFWQAHEEARRAVREDIIADSGESPQGAPRALREAADGIAQAKLLRDAAFTRVVEGGGPLTSGGRTRRAFTVWLAATDRLEKHLRLVGLKRVPKAVDDPLAAVRRAVEEANRRC
jgi:hypothetical protein